MLSRESQRTAGIILIVLPTVIYGGIRGVDAAYVRGIHDF